MANPTFKAIIKGQGGMVAGLAATGEGKARFFIVQKRESQDEFVGRVSGWLKEQGSGGLQMLPPEVLPEGVEVGEVIMRLKHSLGLSRAPDAAEYDVDNVDMVLQTAEGEPAKN